MSHFPLRNSSFFGTQMHWRIWHQLDLSKTHSSEIQSQISSTVLRALALTLKDIATHGNPTHRLTGYSGTMRNRQQHPGFDSNIYIYIIILFGVPGSCIWTLLVIAPLSIAIAIWAPLLGIALVLGVSLPLELRPSRTTGPAQRNTLNFRDATAVTSCHIFKHGCEQIVINISRPC